MIIVQPFSLDVLKTHKSFYLLQKIRDVANMEILHNTPNGYVEAPNVDAFVVPSGKIIVAWKTPLSVAPMYNFVATTGVVSEIINLVQIERVLDIYDKPVDSEIGVFGFSKSVELNSPSEKWRCDNGKYGPQSFRNIQFVGELPEIVVYESLLSVNGVGYLIYMEAVGKQTVANHHVNEDIIPVTGRTFWETLKLVREWETVSHSPFNNEELPAIRAKQFLEELQFSTEELEEIDKQVPMQISNYLTGSTDARKRSTGILPISPLIKQMLFKRMSSCSLSFLEYINGGIYDIDKLVSAEKKQLAEDVAFYTQAKKTMQAQPAFYALQERLLQHREMLLEQIESKTL